MRNRVGNKYLKIEGTKIIMNKPYKYAEAYIDEEYFETAKMTRVGRGYEVIGIFNMMFFTDVETKKDASPLLLMNFPSKFFTIPFSEDKKKMTLSKDIGERNYIVFKYYEGDSIFDNVSLVANFSNTEAFFKVFGDGKFPKCVPFDEILNYMLNNMRINQQKNLDSTPLIFSFIVGESIRAKADKSIPYRLKYDKGEFGWIGANTRSIAANNSTFTAITFEDPNAMLQASLARDEEDDKDNIESPLERTIKM